MPKVLFFFLRLDARPDAVDLGDHLTFSVERTTAGTVAQTLRAVHRANERGMAQDALTAGLAAEHLFLQPFLRLVDEIHCGVFYEWLRADP